MKKSILNLGKALNKAKQKEILGGIPVLIKFECLVNSGDRICCTPQHCGNTGGIIADTFPGEYGTTDLCACF